LYTYTQQATDVLLN